ncbi:MAG: hypothetical protein R3F17_10070 [Planctomycetota bacterium]
MRKLTLIVPLLLAACASLDAPMPVQEERSPVPENINAPFLDEDLNPEDWQNRWEVETARSARSGRRWWGPWTCGRGTHRGCGGGNGGSSPRPSRKPPWGQAGASWRRISRRRSSNTCAPASHEAGLANVRPYQSLEHSVELPQGLRGRRFRLRHHLPPFEYHRDMLAPSNA